MSTVVGLLSPGEMGAFVGGALLDGGADVIWAGGGRSQASAQRARRFRDVETVEALSAAADIVVSVCPPHAALEVACLVADAGFRGVYVDANAVSPVTVADIADVLGAGSLVDGSIVGPPAAGGAVLYLSGDRAQSVGELFVGSGLEPRVLAGRRVGAASALKASFATATKAAGAMLMTAAAHARHYDVLEELLVSWDESDPALVERVHASAAGSAAKAWRFVGEMEQAAASARAAGLPDGYWLAAAETFRRLAVGGDGGSATTPRTLDEAIALID